MKHYKNYEIEDFVWDTFFRQWVLSPTREMDKTWRAWQDENPEMSGRITAAREVVLALRVNEPQLTNPEISRAVKETIAKATAETRTESSAGQADFVPFYKRSWFKIAASLTMIMIFAWLARSGFQRADLAQVSGETGNSALNEDLFIEKVNTTAQVWVINLEDGSKIALAPKSKLRYAKKFVAEKREVYLTGEAFFDISKDPARPFFVYANELVTKVLGTSFRIKAYNTSKEVTVEVKTGRVSVFTKADPAMQETTANHELEGVVLSPNQKIIYARDQVRMVKTLVEKPEIITPKAQLPQFIFEDVPVSEVFESIGKAYGIDILYDEELLRGCPLTATLENQTLHDKLTIICKAIEASYEILDGQIVIHSNGCKN